MLEAKKHYEPIHVLTSLLLTVTLSKLLLIESLPLIINTPNPLIMNMAQIVNSKSIWQTKARCTCEGHAGEKLTFRAASARKMQLTQLQHENKKLLPVISIASWQQSADGHPCDEAVDCVKSNQMRLCMYAGLKT